MGTTCCAAERTATGSVLSREQFLKKWGFEGKTLFERGRLLGRPLPTPPGDGAITPHDSRCRWQEV